MDELIEFIAKSLVDDPTQVEVPEFRRGTQVIMSLRVAKEDMGRIIGRGGRVAGCNPYAASRRGCSGRQARHPGYHRAGMNPQHVRTRKNSRNMNATGRLAPVGRAFILGSWPAASNSRVAWRDYDGNAHRFPGAAETGHPVICR